MAEPTVRSLIELQRRLSQPQRPFMRYIGGLLAWGVLDRRLEALSDRQIAQLMTDEIGHELGIVQLERTILRQATQRLFRSEAGSLEEEPPLRPPCPLCSAKMIFNYGVDEPDFLQCTSLQCGNREYVPVCGANK